MEEKKFLKLMVDCLSISKYVEEEISGDVEKFWGLNLCLGWLEATKFWTVDDDDEGQRGVSIKFPRNFRKMRQLIANLQKSGEGLSRKIHKPQGKKSPNSDYPQQNSNSIQTNLTKFLTTFPYLVKSKQPVFVFIYFFLFVVYFWQKILLFLASILWFSCIFVVDMNFFDCWSLNGSFTGFLKRP